MKILLISDIHANSTALRTVFEAAGSFDAVWVLGDVVGYGPDPNECIEMVRDLPKSVCLLGNHDASTLGMIDVISFNPAARLSVEWTQNVITPENMAYLDQLPQYLRLGKFTLAHGSPREPVWEYLLDTRNATENFDYFYTDFCFVGHTHLPSIYQLDEENAPAKMIIPQAGETIQLKPRAIVNPGSVGQPRDRDPRSAYAIFDTETLEATFHRVEYDIEAVQKRMEIAGLPGRNIMRLSDGW